MVLEPEDEDKVRFISRVLGTLVAPACSKALRRIPFSSASNGITGLVFQVRDIPIASTTDQELAVLLQGLRAGRAFLHQEKSVCLGNNISTLPRMRTYWLKKLSI